MAQSAFAEPEQPPMSMDSSTLTCARPPRMWPVTHSQKSISLSLMPPKFMTEPDMMKNGMASMEKDCVEFMTFCRISHGWELVSRNRK